MAIAQWFGAALAGAPSIEEPVRAGVAATADAALLVGIEDYAFLPDVPWVRRDLAAVTDLLVHTRGVPADHVVRLDGASLDQMWAGLERALAARGPDGTLWVYFAGHGAADPATGELLLVGDDAKADATVFAARGLPVDQLLRHLPDGSVVVLDTCWAGAARTGAPLVPGARFAVPTAAMPREDRLTVWSATSPSEVATGYPAAEHGAFTYFVVGALRGWADGELTGTPDGQVDLAEARGWVARGMAAAGVVGQAPVLMGAEVTALTRGALEAPPELTAFGPATMAFSVPTPFAAPASFRSPLQPAGYRAPLRRVDRDTYADANDRTLQFVQLYGSLQGDLEGEAVMRRYRRSTSVTQLGTILAVTGVTAGLSGAWVPFVIDEDQLGWTLTGAAAGLTAGGVVLALGNTHRVRRAQDELVDEVSHRLTAPPEPR
ncbi:MAG: caspase family protein [Myxococcota bacterium]